jgi:hypothetical protein
MWHVDPLLGSNRGTVFSVRSVLRCHKQDKLGVVSSDENQCFRHGITRVEAG